MFPIWGAQKKKKKGKKSYFVMHNFIYNSSSMSKTEEKLMIQFQEKSWSDEMAEERTEEWIEGQKDR